MVDSAIPEPTPAEGHNDINDHDVNADCCADTAQDDCCDSDHGDRDVNADCCADTAQDDCCDGDHGDHDVNADCCADTAHDDCCDGDREPEADACSPADGEVSPVEDEAGAREAEYEKQIGVLGDQVAQARADLYNLRKEYTNYVRRSKQEASEHRQRGHREVLETLIPVLDDIYAAREAGDLAEGPFAAIAEKLESSLATNYQFERYGTQGEDFDPNRHDALMARDSDEVEVATVAQVLQPGYQAGDAVVRATKVIVDNPTS